MISSSAAKGVSKENPRYLKSQPPKTNGLQKSNMQMKVLEKKVSRVSNVLSARDHRISSANDNMSTFSQNSFYGGMKKLGNTVFRSSRSFFVRNKTGYTSEADEFFYTNSINQWKAEKAAVFKCDNDKDNQPTHIEWRGFNFCVSQNRDEGRKPQGQDCMGVAFHKNWEVFVLCDGHDRDGHLVAQGVCATLPNFLLRRIFERRTEFTNRPIEDSIIIEAFKEAESTVCWSSTNPFEVGDYVKITKGKFKNEIGYIANFLDEDESDDEDSSEEEEEDLPINKSKSKQSKISKNTKVPDPPEVDGKVTVVIDNHLLGYHRIIKKESEILSPRYKGGCTCLCLIRNHQTNKCKTAVLGDSRLMLLGEIGKKFRDADFIDPMLMTTYLDSEEEKASPSASAEKPGNDDQQGQDVDDVPLTSVSRKTAEADNDLVDQVGYFTPQHNVFNANERDRLKAYQEKMNGEYVVNLQEGYLVNPETKMQIQPTRGFGDVEMQSAGYIHLPDISSSFVLTPNTVLVAASDGVFDGDLWGNDEEFLKFVYDLKKQGSTAQKISASIYNETVQRCSDKSGLDDISMFVFVSPVSKKKYKRKQKPRAVKPKTFGSQELNLSDSNVVRSRRQMKSRRVTIQRVDRPGAHLFRKFFSKRGNLLE